jgi:predicted molibdopterin-dependent oxidoreductase YjgC
VHVQDNEIVKVTSPWDHDVTSGHLCIKGRFGFQYVQNRAPVPPVQTADTETGRAAPPATGDPTA